MSSFSKLGQYGRLGNALFEISALVAYCKKHGKIPLIPKWEYHKYFKNIPAPTENIAVDRIYNEPTFEYTEIPKFDGPVDFMGYFQSILYQDGIDVNELFELTDDWKKVINMGWRACNFEIKPNTRTCAVHFRRQDYLMPPHDTYHGVLPLSYYNNAISYLYGEKYDDVLFIVFSDDIKYAKKHFHLTNTVFSPAEDEDERSPYVSCDNDQSILDLFLMSKCDDIVTANSSYSWWGARLGNQNKRVVMPKNWFAGANLNTQDLYLPNAIIL